MVRLDDDIPQDDDDIFPFVLRDDDDELLFVPLDDDDDELLFIPLQVDDYCLFSFCFERMIIQELK